MVALPYSVLPTGASPAEVPETGYRQARTLWLAVQLLDPQPDAVRLAELADWAQVLTPVVVLRPGEGLLLEVQGSLRYFSGLAAIKERLATEIDQRGWKARLAAAPTALAAAWLVRCVAVDVAGRSELAGAIGRLPLAATAWPDNIQLMLRQMGLRSIADCLRLPRDGLARRIGRNWLEELDRALGRTPDPRKTFQPRQRLHRHVEFTTETHSQALLAEALRGMTASCEQELRQRQAQVAEIELRFMHLRREATCTRIRFVDPVHESERILAPLLARIERIALPEPTIALALETDTLLPLRTELSWLVPALPGEVGVSAGPTVPEFAIVECLRGRFGERRVYGISRVAEHRPELAWRHWVDRPEHRVPADRYSAACIARERPLWLLPAPQKVQDNGSGGSVADADPERIESGWWDGQEISRDYHVVAGATGEKLWLYQDRLTDEWYLHGIFG